MAILLCETAKFSLPMGPPNDCSAIEHGSGDCFCECQEFSISCLFLLGASGRPSQTFLDDPRYASVFQRLHELKVPLYVHPIVPLPAVQQAYYSGLPPEVSAQFSLSGWGWHHEAGIHVLHLILSGVFEKVSDLKVISGHWGEMVPFHQTLLTIHCLPK
jgi:hypothetical protein